MIDRYFDRFPGINRYIAETLTPGARARASSRPCSAARRTCRRSSGKTAASARGPSARRSTRRSRAPAPTSSSARWCGCRARSPPPGWATCACCSRSTTNWCSNWRPSQVEAATAVIRETMARAAEPAVTLERAARRRDRHRAELGRGALSATPGPAAAAPAARRRHRGAGEGRAHQLLRLPPPARRALPFLFIAGRIYGADALGRFAYATIIVEFAAQLATLGLQARAGAAAGAHRPAARACRLGCDAARHRSARRSSAAVLIALPAADVPEQPRSTGSTGCCRSPSSAGRLVGHRARRARLSRATSPRP